MTDLHFAEKCHLDHLYESTRRAIALPPGVIGGGVNKNVKVLRQKFVYFYIF